MQSEDKNTVSHENYISIHLHRNECKGLYWHTSTDKTTHTLCAVATTPSLALFQGVCVDRSSYSRRPNTTLTFLQPHPKITHTHTHTHWCRGRWTWNRWLQIHSRSVWVATASIERPCHKSLHQSHTNTLSKHTHRNLHMIRSSIVLFVDKLKEIFVILVQTVKQ